MKKLALCLVLVGCSSSVTAPPAPAASTDAGGEVPEEEEGTQDDAGVDAPPAKRTGTRFEIDYSAMSCNELCAKWAELGDYCGKPCPTDPSKVGTVIYEGGESVKLAACGDKPAATSSSGKKLREVQCCCESPYIVVPGTSPARSCTDVCAARSLSCAADAPWNDFGRTARAAGQAHYSSGGSSTYTLLGCDGVPSPTKNVSNKSFSLQSYSCGCIDR
jgi:hypothetical protein